MFESKIKIWSFIIFIVFSYFLLLKVIPNYFGDNREEISISVDKNNEYLAYTLTETKNYKLSYLNNSDKKDYIIKSKTSENIEDYNKYEKVFYSPFILFNTSSTKMNLNLFKNKDITNTKRIFTVDLKQILEAIEQDKKWKDIAFDKTEEFNQKVTLCIPDKSLFYYKNVIDLMILTLNDFKEPNEDELKILYNRVLNIISKCTTYINVSEITNDLYLMPEFEIINIKYNLNYNIVTPMKTIALYNDLYVLKTEQEEFKLLKDLESDSKILTNYGYRNIYKDYLINDISGFSTADEFVLIDENTLKDTNYTNLDKYSKEIKSENNLSQLKNPLETNNVSSDTFLESSDSELIESTESLEETNVTQPEPSLGTFMIFMITILLLGFSIFTFFQMLFSY